MVIICLTHALDWQMAIRYPGMVYYHSLAETSTKAMNNFIYKMPWTLDTLR